MWLSGSRKDVGPTGRDPDRATLVSRNAFSVDSRTELLHCMFPGSATTCSNMAAMNQGLPGQHWTRNGVEVAHG